MPLLEEYIAWWTAAGEYFGYPPCCVDGFLRMATGVDPRVEEPRPLDGTGYVPCLLCAATYTDEELVARIAAKRLAPDPFPIGEFNSDHFRAWLGTRARPDERVPGPDNGAASSDVRREDGPADRDD